jgi:formylglycine-generating enzyme required for sulfatase activity
MQTIKEIKELDSETISIEIPGEFDEFFADVKDLISQGLRIEKNKKGFWEAYYQDGIVMVYIPAGQFIMGSDEYDKERPVHKIYLDGYWMGKTEVTVKQYMQFVDSTDSHYPAWLEMGNSGNIKTGYKDLYKKLGAALTGDNYPIVGVSWNDAAAYCEWLSKKSGLKFKLSTETQWEKAARGIDGREYPWGDQEPDEDLANFGFCIGKTTSVDLYSQGESPYGLLDMVGNVWEWCNDWYYSDYYNNSPDKNPPGPETGACRVFRGGGWHNNAKSIRCATRNDSVPSFRVDDIGFRLCMEKR